MWTHKIKNGLLRLFNRMRDSRRVTRGRTSRRDQDLTERKRLEKDRQAYSQEREKHMEELERLNQIMMDREARIIELKEEVKTLRKQRASPGSVRSTS